MIFRLVHQTARERAVEAIRSAPDGWIVKVSEPTRSLEANAKLWAMLNDISQQVIWHGRWLQPEDWKHIFTASLKQMQVVPNLDNTGFVALGLSTSKMTKREMSELIELITAFGAQNNVKFGDLLSKP
jgi:hypothetical protein